MKTLSKLLCGVLLAGMLSAITGCDMYVDRGSSAYYQPYHRWGDGYMYHRGYWQPQPDHVVLQGDVNVR